MCSTALTETRPLYQSALLALLVESDAPLCCRVQLSFDEGVVEGVVVHPLEPAVRWVEGLVGVVGAEDPQLRQRRVQVGKLCREEEASEI